MKLFKGFAQIGPLTNNTRGVVAPVGEISTKCRTFTRNLTENVHNDFLGETLVGLSYSENDTSLQVPDDTAYKCLKAINWTYTQARQGRFTENQQVYQQYFIQSLGAEYDLIATGRMVGFGTYYAPEWIEIAPFQGSAENRWKIWFSDDSLYNQYDEFLILVIPPIVNIDAFFDDYDAVMTLMAGVEQTEQFQRMTNAIGKDPQSTQRSDVFLWQDRNDKTLKVSTNWVTAHYGMAGDNLDSVKEAIRDYIMANTTHTRDEWAEIFPDLFTSTEFIVTPGWNVIAVPNGTRDLGVFSGIITFRKAMALCHDTCKGVKYTPAHIDYVNEGIQTLHRGVTAAIVGGPENRDNINQFSLRYPDYIAVPTTHPDFMRMAEETRQFVLLLSTMLLHAETLTPSTGVPEGFNRLHRDGVYYLAKSFKNYLWLVVSKYSVDQLGA